MFQSVVRAALLAAACMVVLGGCSGAIREHVRERDFRAGRANNEPRAAASPIADVVEIPGWTTDLSGALNFARENGQRTVILFYDSSQASSAAISAVDSSQVSNALTGSQKVALDARANGQVANQYGVLQVPSLVVVEPAGSVTGRLDGNITRSGVLSVLR